MSSLLPYLLEPSELVKSLAQDNLLLIDLCKQEQYAQAHISGAIWVNYTNIVTMKPPVMGLLPEKETLQTLFASLGINANTHIVAYDDEGGGKAARLLWTLASVGHQKMSLLNGGLHAWCAESLPLVASPSYPTASTETYEFNFQDNVIANQDYIIKHLDDPSVICMDTRSEAEYSGIKKFADRAGHIPGAIHLDWIELMDQNNSLRLKKADELKLMLESLQINPDKEIIVYCQSHHRSALSFVALTSLGYQKVKGYPGSWSDWGNSQTTPIELTSQEGQLQT